MISSYVLAVIVASAVVTWIPRVLPYFIVKLIRLPEKVVEFLGYLPITIIFALILSSLFHTSPGSVPLLKWQETLSCLPAVFVILKTRNIMLAVLAGVLCLAFLRLIGI